MHSAKTIFGALVLFVLAGCTSLVATAPEKDKTYGITVLHTNDHHGRFWQNDDGEYGMSARKTVIDSIRREVSASGGYSLLLDGGDVNTGVPESDLQDAVPDFQGMNLLGYDAMAVGNHEFDKSPAVLKMQRSLARFPMLSANIYSQGTRLFDAYKVFNLGGVRIAVIGLTTDDTRKMANPDNIRAIEFRNAIQEATQLVPEVRSKADVVIAATHMGHYENGNHGTQAPGDVEMARAVTGIDLIVGGHTQNPACMKAENNLDRAYVPGAPCTPDRQNGTWIVQAHEWGKYVGRADFQYRNGDFRLVNYSLIPINLKRLVKGLDGIANLVNYTPEIAEDQDMLALLRPYRAFGQQKLLVDVGNSDARLEGDRALVRSQPTTLGVLVAQAMMARTGADLAIVNAGGVRDSLPGGRINYKDVLKVHPFGNTVVTLDLSGAELLDYLATAAKMSAGSGAFPQFSGVALTITSGGIRDARIQGNAIDPARVYRLAINSFMAVGGDGYPRMDAHKSFVNTGFVDADVLRSFIASNSPLRAAAFEPGNSVTRTDR